MAGVLSAAQLASLRATVTGVLPDTGRCQRTGASFPVQVTPQSHEVKLPGAAPLVTVPRWQIAAPFGTDLRLFDVLTVATLGQPSGLLLGGSLGFGVQTGPSFWVCQVPEPRSYQTQMTVLVYQLTDQSGGLLDPMSANCTVRQYRQGTQIGASRRVRYVPSRPDQMGPDGERLSDMVFTQPADDAWALSDVLELVSVDGFASLPHPHRFRVQAPRFHSDPPAVIVLELTGEGGSYER